jgi:hypothetical protein
MPKKKSRTIRSVVCVHERFDADWPFSADVFDIEPVALDSPLLGRDNVVHTPHNAGRTIDVNHAWADDQIARFRPR